MERTNIPNIEWKRMLEASDCKSHGLPSSLFFFVVWQSIVGQTVQQQQKSEEKLDLLQIELCSVLFSAAALDCINQRVHFEPLNAKFAL